MSSHERTSRVQQQNARHTSASNERLKENCQNHVMQQQNTQCTDAYDNNDANKTMCFTSTWLIYMSKSSKNYNRVEKKSLNISNKNIKRDDTHIL